MSKIKDIKGNIELEMKLIFIYGMTNHANLQEIIKV